MAERYTRRRFLQRTGEATVGLVTIPTVGVLFDACGSNPSQDQVPVATKKTETEQSTLLTIKQANEQYGSLPKGTIIKVKPDNADISLEIQNVYLSKSTPKDQIKYHVTFSDQTGPGTQQSKDVYIGTVREDISYPDRDEYFNLGFFATPELYAKIQADRDTRNLPPQEIAQNMTFRVADIEEIKSLDTKYPDVNGSFLRLLEVIDYTSPNQ